MKDHLHFILFQSHIVFVFLPLNTKDDIRQKVQHFYIMKLNDFNIYWLSHFVCVFIKIGFLID